MADRSKRPIQQLARCPRSNKNTSTVRLLISHTLVLAAESSGDDSITITSVCSSTVATVIIGIAVGRRIVWVT